ncbi:MAG: recombinase family protein [Pseudomonadota bacterium]|nr:recombinase family protein [Pseudomonadota bacterium]
MRYSTRDRGPKKPPSEPAPPPRRAAVMYARVSSRDQEREGYSIPAQQKSIREYAEQHGFQIVEEFVDIETAKKSGRTNFTKMLAYVRKRHANPPAVLVEKTDRLYRNLKDWVTVDEMKTEIHLVKENVVISEDSRSSEKFMHGIKVLMAKNYVDNLSEEVKKGMYMKAEEGHWPSRAPFGYLNRRDGDKSFIVPDPERALMVRNLFELYEKGTHSLEELAAYARDAGLTGRLGGKLIAAQIHIILRNPIYMGEFRFGGALYRSKDPALVSRDLWQRVQDRLDGHPDTRPGPRNFLYQGLMTCGHCGAAITAEMKKQKYTYYRCSQLCTKDKTTYVREERIAELLADNVVRGLQLPPAKMGFAARVLKTARVDVVKETHVRLADARARYDRFKRLIDKAYEDKLEGRVDDAFFARKRLEWEEGMRIAHEDVTRFTRADLNSMNTALELLELLSSAYEAFNRKTPSQQRGLLNLLLSNCQLQSGTIRATYREPYDFIAKFADSKNDDGAESGDPDLRHQVWSG